jgi:hypothetical protein
VFVGVDDSACAVLGVVVLQGDGDIRHGMMIASCGGKKKETCKGGEEGTARERREGESGEERSREKRMSDHRAAASVHEEALRRWHK